MEFLTDIPIIGVVFQFVGYVISSCPSWRRRSWPRPCPIVLGALCGFMNERSGVVNIGIEGMMLTAAFVAWWAASIAGQFLPDLKIGVMGITLRC